MKFARNRVGPTTKDGTSRSRCFEKYPRRAPRTSRVGVWGLAHGAPGAQVRYRPLLEMYSAVNISLRETRFEQETVRAQWMEDAVEELAHRALSHAQGKRSVSHHRYIIGIAGVPGGGKSTLASAVCSCINKLAASEIAANVPMDGFHYYRRELDSMPDPVQAHKRRGAPWTFNVEAYVNRLKQAKFLVTSMTAPSFDHGIGDPKENAIEIHSHHSIIVTEGNYVLLGQLLMLGADGFIYDFTYTI